jgi:hypothetical protein
VCYVQNANFLCPLIPISAQTPPTPSLKTNPMVCFFLGSLDQMDRCCGCCCTLRDSWLRCRKDRHCQCHTAFMEVSKQCNCMAECVHYHVELRGFQIPHLETILLHHTFILFLMLRKVPLKASFHSPLMARCDTMSLVTADWPCTSLSMPKQGILIMCNRTKSKRKG